MQGAIVLVGLLLKIGITHCKRRVEVIPSSNNSSVWSSALDPPSPPMRSRHGQIRDGDLVPRMARTGLLVSAELLVSIRRHRGDLRRIPFSQGAGLLSAKASYVVGSRNLISSARRLSVQTALLKRQPR